MTDLYDDEPEYERDYHQEWKDNVMQGIHDEDGNPLDPEPPEPEPTLGDLLADTAHGWGEHAAVWLLAAHGHWLPELARCELIGDADGYRIQWAAIDGKLAQLIGTLSELQVLALARALAVPARAATLSDLTSLDEDNRRLVVHAVAWAAGGEQWALGLRVLPPEPSWGYSDESPF